MIISFLRERIPKNKKYKDNVKFINNSDRKFIGNISFNTCFGHGVLLVIIDTESFGFCQKRLFTAKLVKNMGAVCFKCIDCVKILTLNDSVRMYDAITEEQYYIKPKGTITAEFDKKYVYVLNFCLDKFY